MPLSYEEEIELRRETVLELASKGWTQQQIAQKLGYSQAQISKDLTALKSRAREQLATHYLELPIKYRMVIANLEAIRKEAWQTVSNTQDSRSKSVLFNTLIAVNRELLDVLAAADLVHEEVANAELIAKEAKEDLQRAKEKIAEQAGSKELESSVDSSVVDPQTGGFERSSSISTEEEVAVDSKGSVAIAVVDSREEEEDSSSDSSDDSSSSSDDSSSSSTYDIVGSDSASSSIGSSSDSDMIEIDSDNDNNELESKSKSKIDSNENRIDPLSNTSDIEQGHDAEGDSSSNDSKVGDP